MACYSLYHSVNGVRGCIYSHSIIVTSSASRIMEDFTCSITLGHVIHFRFHTRGSGRHWAHHMLVAERSKWNYPKASPLHLGWLKPFELGARCYGWRRY